jgi:hypothetical protein
LVFASDERRRVAREFLLIAWKMQKPNQAPKRSVE